MKYQHIVQAEFIDRPNRFIAHVKLAETEPLTAEMAAEAAEIEKEADAAGGSEGVTVHVKNTGRCRELLVPGATVYLEKSANPNRSTAYDLVAVEKGERLINMDSQAPNKVVEEWLWKKELFPDLILVRPETKYGNSRFDFYVETAGDRSLGRVGEKIFIEVKGVTLEENGVCRFPDAPTERGVKHIRELIKCRSDGYEAYILFVIQLSPVKYLEPNDVTHKAFGDALREAAKAGVHVLARDCKITIDSMEIMNEVEVRL